MLLENVQLVIVTLPAGLQLIPAALFAPEVPLPVMTELDNESESLVPPPRIAPPPNACANPPESVTPEMFTATLPTTLGSSSSTRKLTFDWWMIVPPAPAPTRSVRWFVALPSWSSPVPVPVRLYVPAGTLIVFGVAEVLAVLLAASVASRRLILASGPGDAIRPAMLAVLPSTMSLVVE